MSSIAKRTKMSMDPFVRFRPANENRLLFDATQLCLPFAILMGTMISFLHDVAAAVAIQLRQARARTACCNEGPLTKQAQSYHGPARPHGRHDSYVIASPRQWRHGATREAARRTVK